MVSIVVTGPESTGKSVLTEFLSEHFNGNGVQEYARKYVEDNGGHYSFDDVERIAHHQVEEYQRMNREVARTHYVFFDTFLIITKVWFQEVFACCPKWLHEAILECSVDFALLCVPDLPWEEDGVRENRDKREYLFECYKNELNYYGIPFATVQGEGDLRIQNALDRLSDNGFPVD